MKTILITGSSSGIGKSCKIVFLKNGFKVIGLDINEQNNEDNLLPFKTSILDENNLKSISEYLSNNNIKLDIILNVAGIHKMASLVENEFNDLKKVIDVNLQGTMLINNIFHKHLKEKGRIIIVTSEVAGFDPMPFNGLYNVSKTALDCYAQALRQELNLLGQKVITIRPGAIKTPLCDKSLEDTKKLALSTNLYKKQAHKFLKLTKKFMGKPLNSEKISKLIYKAAIVKKPKLVYKKHRNLGLILLNLLPIKLQCHIIKLLLNH